MRPTPTGRATEPAHPARRRRAAGVLAALAAIGGLSPNPGRAQAILNVEWRHDSRPPGGVVPNDVVMRTGFTFSF